MSLMSLYIYSMTFSQICCSSCANSKTLHKDSCVFELFLFEETSIKLKMTPNPYYFLNEYFLPLTMNDNKNNKEVGIRFDIRLLVFDGGAYIDSVIFRKIPSDKEKMIINNILKNTHVEIVSKLNWVFNQNSDTFLIPFRFW